MSKLKKGLWAGLRLGFCLLLLLWIFHTIFLNEGKVAAQNSGLDWSRMDRSQQWRLAWATGPRDLWHTLRLAHPVALLVSGLLVGSRASRLWRSFSIRSFSARPAAI